jgi:hypothetical protein
MPSDRLDLSLSGCVLLQDGQSSTLKTNRVLLGAAEGVLRALMTDNERISTIVLVNGQGLTITPGLNFLPTPAFTMAVGSAESLTNPPFIKTTGDLKNIGVWTGSGTPTSTFQYDTLGLLMTSGIIFAATNVGLKTANAGVPLNVQWSITLGA